MPKAALAHVVDVVAARSLGAGSASQRIQITTALMQLVYPMVGPQEQNNILKDYVSALAGQNAAARYVPHIGSDTLPTDDDSVAVLENDALMRGGEALVSPNQNHARHAARHLQKAFELIPAVQQQQIPPQAALMAWENIGPHVANHYGFIANDPTQKREAQALKIKLDELSKMTDKLKQNLQEQAEAQETQGAMELAAGGGEGQQPQGEQVPPGMAELMKTRGELDIRMKQVEDEMQRQREAHQQKMQQGAEKHAMSMKAADEKRAYARPGAGAPASE